MVQNESDWLTTGEAAALCSVTPDTILKWIKKGRIEGMRTAGGHYRVERQAIESYIRPPAMSSDPQAPWPQTQAPPLRCWEYLSHGGVIREECKACNVYRVRAAWCFQLAGLGCQVGREGQADRPSCQDCGYYRRVKGLPTHVLVISSSQNVIAPLQSEKDENLEIRFALNAYEASSSVETFRPAFAIIDSDLVGSREPGLVESLSGDPRLPGLKIVLAVPPGSTRRSKGGPDRRRVAGYVTKPFGVRQIVNLVNEFPIEAIEPSERIPLHREKGERHEPAER